jgi:hypothetical protein
MDIDIMEMGEIKKMGGPKRFSKGIRIADNPLSRNIARIFNQSEDSGTLLVRENDKFGEKAREIREKIIKKYDLGDKKRNTFKDKVFIQWIRPATADPSMPYRNPNLQDLARFCEAIGKDLWEMFLDPDQIHLNRLPQERRELFRKILSMSDNQELLNAVTSIVEIYDTVIKSKERAKV